MIANALSQMGRLIFGVLRYFTIKDSRGHPRWTWTTLLLAITGAIVAAAFLVGVVFRGTNAFDRLKTQIQMTLAGETIDPADVWAQLDDDELALTWRPFETNNKTLERVSIPIGQFFGSGGSIFQAGEHLGFVTPKGRIGYISDITSGMAGTIAYSDVRVPMRIAAFEDSRLANEPRFNRNWFRTLDSIIAPREDGSYDLYVSHHRYDDACFTITVSRTQISVTSGEMIVSDAGWEPVFEAQPCPDMKTIGNLYSGLRDGGRMAFAEDGKLLLTIGDLDFDGDNSYVSAPMDPDYDFGKIHEIDLQTGTSEIYAIGMRNPQGLHVTHDGLIFTSEHGPNGGDEINLIARGANYGWPEVTLGMSYGFPRRPWPTNPTQGRHDGAGYTSPVFAFVPSIGIGAVTEITSDLFADWNGDLLVASLENQGLYRLRRNGGEVIYSERTEIGERMRDLLELSNGQIAMLTDSARIILLRPRPPLNAEEPEVSPRQLRISGFAAVREETTQAAAANASLGIHPGRSTFEAKCATCHALDSTEIVVGPHLNRIAGRRVGAVEGFPYSDAMTGSSKRWTEERIRLYLSDPDAEFPNSNMPQVQMTLPEYLHVAWWLTNCTGGRDRPECHTDG